MPNKTRSTCPHIRLMRNLEFSLYGAGKTIYIIRSALWFTRSIDIDIGPDTLEINNSGGGGGHDMLII